MKIDICNNENKKVETMELPDGFFNAKWNPDLVHQVVTSILSNRRKPWAHAKDRSEVSGGGKKPWRQKGTGRARVGSNRSPIWTGGGITFGPNKERNYKKKINKKMKRAALFSVLSKKLSDGEIKIIDNFNIKSGKTKEASKLLGNFINKKNKKESVLFVASKENKSSILAIRNMVKNDALVSEHINAYNCLSHKSIFFEKDAVIQLIDNFNKAENK